MMNENIGKKIVSFKEKLEIIKETHPNLYKLWSNYLDGKISSLNETIDRGNSMIETTKNIIDLTEDEILTTYYIKNHFN